MDSSTGPAPATWSAADRWLQRSLPKLVLSPTLVVSLVFVYGFILWTAYLSFTPSKGYPIHELVGFLQYVRVWNHPRWQVAIHNLAIFGMLYIVLCMALGLLLAILLDQRIRQEGTLRAIYLYPLALSFIVTGTAWKWMLNPGLGIEKLVQGWGFQNFKFDWIVSEEMAIYCVVMAGVWQATGFVMAMFLAGLRGIDQDLIKAASLDGASLPKIYWRIVIPQLRPVFMGALIILAHLAIKSYELVVALTGGGPGYATELPSTFMYAHTFTRNQLGMGAASAVMMLLTIVAIMVPYLYSEMRAAGKRSH
jgi:glucose/mannose transport system permease protein